MKNSQIDNILESIQESLDDLKKHQKEKEDKCPHMVITVVTHTNLESFNKEGSIYPPETHIECNDCKEILPIKKIIHKLEN